MTPEMQRRFGYDPAKAAAFQAAASQARAQWVQQQQAAAQKQAAAKQKAMAEQQAEMAEKTKTDDENRKLKANALPMRVEIIQVLEDGGLAIPIERKKKGAVLGRSQYVTVYGDDLFFLEGIPGGYVDGQEWVGRASRDGVYQYETADGGPRTIKKYRVVK